MNLTKLWIHLRKADADEITTYSVGILIFGFVSFILITGFAVVTGKAGYFISIILAGFAFVFGITTFLLITKLQLNWKLLIQLPMILILIILMFLCGYSFIDLIQDGWIECTTCP